jgi:pyruvate/2-oxoglutarate/acetoin dehydrogenase E1 component
LNSEKMLGDVLFPEAVRCALEDAMLKDQSIVLLGQDIAAGFPFGATRDLADVFGHERVRDTPISEGATMGCAIGAAIMGVRTVVEVDFAGFLLLGLDQLVNNAAKLRYMSGGQLRVPLLVRVGQGPLGAFAAQHSQSQHAWLASVPGLAVCAPSDPQDAYVLMRWALRQGDPVVFAEDMRLYRSKGPLRREAGGGGGLEPAGGGPGLVSERPGPMGGESESVGGGLEPIPPARVVRAGNDATVMAFGYGTKLALGAAEELAVAGIELEIVDLRLLSPLDERSIGESARRTGRVLCLGDDPLRGGITATLAAVVDESAHAALKAPVARLGARHLPTPFGSAETYVYPSVQSVVAAVRRLVAYPEPAAGTEIANGDFAMGGPPGGPPRSDGWTSAIG